MSPELNDYGGNADYEEGLRFITQMARTPRNKLEELLSSEDARFALANLPLRHLRKMYRRARAPTRFAGNLQGYAIEEEIDY